MDFVRVIAIGVATAASGAPHADMEMLAGSEGSVE